MGSPRRALLVGCRPDFESPRPRDGWRFIDTEAAHTLPRLQSAVQGHSGRGVVEARTAVTLVRERVDSPRESWLRLCLVLAGMPMPECNLIIGDHCGPIGRVDLVYIAYKLIIEYEGDQHRTDRNQWNRDIDRQEDFARDNWMLIRVTSERAR
jgi:hypothetical protein